MIAHLVHFALFLLAMLVAALVLSVGVHLIAKLMERWFP